MDFSVMSFNLRVDSWLDFSHRWARRLPGIRDLIQWYSPLVIGTQEGLPHMLQQLQTACPEYAFVGSGRLGNGTSEHCAIFYRADDVEALEWGQFWLSATPAVASRSWGSAYPRICTWVRFAAESKPHEEFYVFNTHLDHVSQRARLNGALVIWQEMQRRRIDTGLPAILTGDLNADPEEDAVLFLRGHKSGDGFQSDLVDAARLLHEPAGRTYHGFRGGSSGQPIDYIFVTPDIAVNHVRVERNRYCGRYPSDHYPMIADISLCARRS